MSTHKSTTLIDILIKVSLSKMDVETAEKKITKLFAAPKKHIGSGLNLDDLRDRLHKQISKETRKSLSDWLKKQRENERKAQSKSQ